MSRERDVVTLFFVLLEDSVYSVSLAPLVLAVFVRAILAGLR